MLDKLMRLGLLAITLAPKVIADLESGVSRIEAAPSVAAEIEDALTAALGAVKDLEGLL